MSVSVQFLCVCGPGSGARWTLIPMGPSGVVGHPLGFESF